MTRTLAVIGAGPAGLAAAVTAAEQGMTVTVIDAGLQSGGQFWRHPSEPHLPHFARDESVGHHHWRRFVDLRTRLDAAVARGAVRRLYGRQVWQILAGGTGFVLHTAAVAGADPVPPAERAVSAERVILATGAYDRQLPVPGWTLPGVMAAGGVQALVKAHQIAPGRRAVVAGTGPFLLSVAAGLAEAGVEVVAVCEANSLLRWARRPLHAALEPGKLLEGAEYARTFLRHRIPFRSRTIVTRVHGEDRAEGVSLSRVDTRGRATGEPTRVDADLVAFGWGFTPQLELAVQLGLRTRLDVDGSLVVDIDADHRASLSGVYVAGEATGIGGAVQSWTEGELAARTTVADALGTDAPARRRGLRRRVARARAFARAMHAASVVPTEWSRWLEPDTLVCRCEEVDAAAIAEAVDDQRAEDPRDVRVTARPGMGWCQGRVCGFALASLVGERTGCRWSTAQIEPLHKRSIGIPLPLGEIAALAGASTPPEPESPHAHALAPATAAPDRP
ncbi:FAD-dependent oxidoreductase [Microbacterium trichothecenolyticum]|uniref:Thioredoxin reductase n=1 Tax=Microbacterium trichothecenolyticum TaxID=69370 RepID=A0ABU0TS61_MICTR|nr:FAD-dependent oxidoreductase [Microbacterium trichothecenolyticum]MDQ1122508.1 thioredoxin reductase [Microbacterium trichothecenolyticum]